MWMIKKRTIGILLFAALPAVAILLISVQKRDQQYKTDYSILISHYTLPESDYTIKYNTHMVIIFKKNTIQLVCEGEWMTYRIDKYIEKDRTYILEMIYATFLKREDYPDLAYLALQGDQIWYFTVGVRFQQTMIFYIDRREKEATNGSIFIIPDYYSHHISHTVSY